MPPVIYFFFSVSKFIVERKIDIKKGIGVFLGVFIGWVVRPDFIEASKLVYIQIVEHTILKTLGVPLTFGGEHQPLLWITLFRNFWLILLIFIFCFVLLLLVNFI